MRSDSFLAASQMQIQVDCSLHSTVTNTDWQSSLELAIPQLQPSVTEQTQPKLDKNIFNVSHVLL